MKLTQDQLQRILPINREAIIWLPLLNKFLPQYGIDSRDRVIMFLAQTSHESMQYTTLKENLYYTSPLRIAQIFKTGFDLNKNSKVDSNEIEFAKAYIRNPIKLASRCYANKIGNGDEASQDGWKYRGRGLIQITGKNNYNGLSLFLEKSIEDTVLYMETKEGALIGSIYFWLQNQINSFADVKDTRGATKRINGGIQGLSERINEYNRISTII